jgi:hypothetical protein
MIAPYLAGWVYWPLVALAPLTHDDPFALRAAGLLLGLLSISLTFRVVHRLAGPAVAAVTALAAAVAPCFVLLHSTLLAFETVPWVCTMGAVSLLLGCPALRPGSPAPVPGDPPAVPAWRAAAIGILAGAALAANAKSVLVFAVFTAVALRMGVPVRRIAPRAWAAGVGACLVPLAPMIALLLSPVEGYGDKSSGWTRTLFAHLLEPRWLLTALRGLILMFADIGFYLGNFTPGALLHLPAAMVAVGALLFVLVDAARTLWRGKGCPVTAAAGLVVVVFTAMVTLLYDHFPSNFTSLHTVYAAAIGVTAVRLAGALRMRARASWAIVPVAAAMLFPFAVSTADMIRLSADIELHTNAEAERALAATLAEARGDRALLITGDAMIAGVPDAMTPGGVHTLRADDFFAHCQPGGPSPVPAGCVEERWRALLPFAVKTTAHFISPVDWSRWGSHHASYVPGLLEAGRAMGYRVTEERTFTTPRGVPVLALYRIDAPGAAAP